LDWGLLRCLAHEVSVFDDLSGDPPPYMAKRNTIAEPDFMVAFQAADCGSRCSPRSTHGRAKRRLFAVEPQGPERTQCRASTSRGIAVTSNGDANPKMRHG
jgi:hypothetical protein